MRSTVIETKMRSVWEKMKSVRKKMISVWKKMRMLEKKWEVFEIKEWEVFEKKWDVWNKRMRSVWEKWAIFEKNKKSIKKNENCISIFQKSIKSPRSLKILQTCYDKFSKFDKKLKVEASGPLYDIVLWKDYFQINQPIST